MGDYSFAPPRVIGSAPAPAEAVLAVSTQGLAVLGAETQLWRSTDAGHTFAALGRPTCPVGLSQCPGLETHDAGVEGHSGSSLTVDESGRLHRIGWRNSAPLLPYQRSVDAGRHWTAPVDLSMPRESVQQPWIASRGSDRLYAAWPSSGSTPQVGIAVRSSADGGVTWGNTSYAYPGGRPGPIELNPVSDQIVVPVAHSGRLVLARSQDHGLTWFHATVAKLAGTVHVYPVAAFDRAGTLYVAWAEDTRPLPRSGLEPGASPEIPAVFLSVSKDQGRTFSAPIRLSRPDAPAMMPWLVAGTAGRVALVWYESDAAVPAAAPARWFLQSAGSYEADSAEPTFVVRRVAAQPVHVGSFCSGGNLCQLGGDRSLGYFPQLRLLPDGTPLAAWSQDADARLVRVDVAVSAAVGLDLTAN